MKKAFICIAIVIIYSCKPASPVKAFQKSLFKAYDLTGENLFSNNIEGPAVDKKGNLFVVNFGKDGTIGQVHEDGRCELFVNLPEKSTGNSIQFNSAGNMLIADFTGHNILMVNMSTKNVSVFSHNDNFNQPNDICLNKKDQVFASDPNWKEKTGNIWRIDGDGKSVLLKDKMGTTNGICLSPDEKILYVNESVQRKVWAFDLDENGDLSNKRLFTDFTDFGMDGMKCDKEGNLYICRYGKGAVSIFSPAGKQIQEVVLKGKNVSNITFGGKDYKTCFVTLQDRKGMEMFRSDIAGK